VLTDKLCDASPAEASSDAAADQPSAPYGKDEAIFLMAGYDRGGYALYYDNFRKVAVVSWIYH
jgi:hypothetical protein